MEPVETEETASPYSMIPCHIRLTANSSCVNYAILEGHLRVGIQFLRLIYDVFSEYVKLIEKRNMKHTSKLY